MENTNLQSSQLMNNPELLTRDEVAQLLHVSLSFIDHLNDLPSYKLGKKKLFNKAEVLEYLNKNRTTPLTYKISKTDKIFKSKEDADE